MFGFRLFLPVTPVKDALIVEKFTRSREKGEKYACISCGCSLDADTNASINILNSFLNGECGGSSSHLAVSHGIKKEKTDEI